MSLIEVQDILIFFGHFSSQESLIRDRTFINFQKFSSLDVYYRNFFFLANRNRDHFTWHVKITSIILGYIHFNFSLHRKLCTKSPKEVPLCNVQNNAWQKIKLEWLAIRIDENKGLMVFPPRTFIQGRMLTDFWQYSPQDIYSRQDAYSF